MKFAWLALSVWSVANLALAQIQQAIDAPEPRTPEESAAAFKLTEGFRMEVVASEPLISSPSAVCWDERGRMFVSELHGYNLAGQLDIEELNKTGRLLGTLASTMSQNDVLLNGTIRCLPLRRSQA